MARWSRVERVGHGVVAAVGIPEAQEVAELAASRLSDAERVHLATRGRRKEEFVAGRLAVRAACLAFGVEIDEVLPDEKGAPCIPQPLTGSISHSLGVAVAIVGHAEDGTLGIDVEPVERFRARIEGLVLTTEERAAIGDLSGAERARAVLLRFSAKEALYKALHRQIERDLSFLDAHVHPRQRRDGSRKEGLLGEELDVNVEWETGEGPFVVHGRYGWESFGLLTCVRVRRE
jgi:4'-phosphopantetheinyl transferase EntD